MQVEVIELYPITAECIVCGDVSRKSGIPMYEDFILPNDYEGEWGGQPACDRCRKIQERMIAPITLAEFKAAIAEASAK